jgi:hypothetical protein
MAGPIKRKMGVDSKSSNIDISSHIWSDEELEFRNRLLEMKKAHKAQIKELEKEKIDYRALSDMKNWQKLTELKRELEATNKKDGVFGWNLKRISTMMEYYTYQHPKKPMLKSDKESDLWVTDFINKGGKLATLIDTANKSRVATWQRISGGKKRRKKKSSDTAVDTKITTSSTMSMRGKT